MALDVGRPAVLGDSGPAIPSEGWRNIRFGDVVRNVDDYERAPWRLAWNDTSGLSTLTLIPCTSSAGG